MKKMWMSAIQTLVKTTLPARMWLMATSANVFLDILVIINIVIVIDFYVQVSGKIFNMESTVLWIYKWALYLLGLLKLKADN